MSHCQRLEKAAKLVERFDCDALVPFKTTMETLEPQPAKKRCIETGVLLQLPAGVVVPPFYEQERDASAISTALQLGADAVCHLRSQAEERRLQELLEKKASELTQCVEKLEAELYVVREKADREVEQRVAEQTLALTQTLELRNGLRNEDIDLFKSARQKLRETSESLDDLEKKAEIRKRSTNDQVQTVRDDERRSADADIRRITDVYQSEVSFLKDLYSSLVENSKKRGERVTQMLNDLNKKLREAEDRALVAGSKSTAQGAAGEATLCELLKQAFGMAQDFDVCDTSKKSSSGDLTARIWGLQTMWDCKNYSSSVPSKEVDKIKHDLSVHPEIDVAFLVALRTDIAGHKDQHFHVELVSSSQTLVYVNRLTDNANPVKLLQVFVRPLLSALRHVKQVYTERRAHSASDLQHSVSRWVQKLNEQLNELDAEQKELAAEKKHFNTRYKARESRIKKREAALSKLLEAMNVCS